MSSLPQHVNPSEPYAASCVEPGPVRCRGRVVGHLTADGAFRRRIHGRHLLRKPVPAVAVSVAVLVELARRGCTALVFTLDGGRELTAAPGVFWGPGSFVVERGHGQQRAVALDVLASVSVRRVTDGDVMDEFLRSWAGQDEPPPLDTEAMDEALRLWAERYQENPPLFALVTAT